MGGVSSVLGGPLSGVAAGAGSGRRLILFCRRSSVSGGGALLAAGAVLGFVETDAAGTADAAVAAAGCDPGWFLPADGFLLSVRVRAMGAMEREDQ